MKINYSKKFVKQYSKQNIKIKNKFIERQNLLISDSFDFFLNNHSLSGEFVGYRSINITGDIRAIFEETGDDSIEFIAIGSHSELYS